MKKIKENDRFLKILLNTAIITVILAGSVVITHSREKERYPFLNTDLTIEERIKNLLSRMTLEEKISQMGNTSPGITRLGIPEYQWWNECLHGVMSVREFSTVFPQAIGLASTWNPSLIYRVASAISDEARAMYNRRGFGISGRIGIDFWSPVINIARDPRWGRTQEGYGEDPYLVSRIAVSFVKGLQGNHPRYVKVISTPKHYALNNEEWRRHSGSSDVDERILREYYLPPYKACIVEAKAQSVMCAYNAVNGVPSCCNKKLLKDILREEWGFDGYVVADCCAIRDIYENHRFASSLEEAAALAINAGCDLDCNIDCSNIYQLNLLKAVEKGLVSEETIDKSLGRLLKARFSLGMFDPQEMVPYSKISHKIIDCEEHRELARQAARESIVLLKNVDNLLPLKKNIKSIAVIGPNANICRMGNYSGICSKAVTPLEGIENKVSPKTKVYYKEGSRTGILFPVISAKYFTTDSSGKKHGLKAEYFNNADLSGEPVLVRTDRRIDFNWMENSPVRKVNPGNYSIRWTGKLIPPVSRIYQMSLTTDDNLRVFIDDRMLIDAKYDDATVAREATYLSSVKLDTGRSYNIRIEYVKKQNVSGIARLGWNYIPNGIKRSVVEIAKKSDVVVVFVGNDLSVAQEEMDRSILDLPGIQEDLIRKIYKVNPKTVVVLINGEPLSFIWTKENIPAIVEAWYPGEEGGNAIADVLFGDYNPGGRLPLTFYESVDQLPPFDDYDILKGRTYMYFEGKPLYPFGHGLSYTKFSYSNLRIRQEKQGSDERIKVSVDVENTGEMAGDEVVQLYVHDVNASVKRPIKELRGFRRVNFKPREKKEIEFELNARDLSFYNVDRKKFAVEPGTFEVMAGSSSEEIRLKDSFEVK